MLKYFCFQNNNMPVNPMVPDQETQVIDSSVSEKSAAKAFDKNFKPRGAIAFFLLLVLLGMVIWFGIYFLMLERI
jgi:hypothetical protein